MIKSKIQIAKSPIANDQNIKYQAYIDLQNIYPLNQIKIKSSEVGSEGDSKSKYCSC